MTHQDYWYVVYTYPNCEKKIYNELIKRNIDAFLPTRQQTRQWSDRKKKIEVPLFPNYIFVKISSRCMWNVLMINGVARFVSFNEGPAAVKDAEIDVIKRITANCNEINNEDFCLKGEKVQVQHGPLQGLIGKVVDKKGLTKLYIELETVSQTISVEIDAAQLGKVEEVWLGEFQPA
jgi:transcription antitermination factor NusG